MFINIAKVDFADQNNIGPGPGPGPEPSYTNSLYFTPSGSSATVGYKYSEYYGNHDKYLLYSYDEKEWQPWTSDITVPAGKKLYVRGEDNYIRDEFIDSGFFTTSAPVNCGGNLSSLVNKTTSISTSYCFNNLFNGTKVEMAPTLDPTFLRDYAYAGMFKNCENLKKTPALPSLIIGNSCYANMFEGCTSLTDIRPIAASAVKTAGYKEMFKDCTALVNPPLLDATDLDDECYKSMFEGCTSLVKTPNLPSKSVDSSSYESMFKGCTSLTTASNIQATDIGYKGCDSMFEGCTSLVNPPVMVATTVLESGCEEMFKDCTSLMSTPVINATSVGVNAFKSAFENDTALVTASDLPAGAVDTASYKEMFKNCTSLVNMPVISATSVSDESMYAMFDGCESLITTKPLNATTLGNETYAYMFNNNTSLEEGPEIYATTLGAGSMENMFNGCNLKEAPELRANEIALGAYDHLFNSNSELNWIKSLNLNTFDVSLSGAWTEGVADEGVFVVNIGITWEPENYIGINAIPENWLVIYYDEVEEKYYLDNEKAIECDKYGNPILSDEDFHFIGEGTVSYQYAEYLAEHGKYLKYCIEGEALQDWTEDITLPDEKKVFVIGLDNYIRKVTKFTSFFTVTGEVEAHGNISTLIAGSDIARDYCFKYLFRNQQSLVSAPDIDVFRVDKYAFDNAFYGTSIKEPTVFSAITVKDYGCQQMFANCGELKKSYDLSSATTLSKYAFQGMFMNCSKLTTVSELPAEELAEAVYQNMYKGCTSLTKMMELPAMTLAYDCYHSMFEGCTNLYDVVDELPAMIMSYHCYTSMFAGCTGLAKKMVLPATTLADGCYAGMFMNCSSLSNLPELPAEKMAPNCYSEMFAGTAVSTKIPELNSTQLAYGCYRGMFKNCTNLTKVPELPATTINGEAYAYMFEGCVNITKAPELPATEWAGQSYYGTNQYSAMFKGCTSLTEAPFLPATSIGYGDPNAGTYDEMFYGCTNINYIKVALMDKGVGITTMNWVKDVAPTGKFLLPFGSDFACCSPDSIPEGWEVIYYDPSDPDYPVDNGYFYITPAEYETQVDVDVNTELWYQLHSADLLYSFDKVVWNTVYDTITVWPNQKLYLRSDEEFLLNSPDQTFWTITGRFDTGGNIMSMCHFNDVVENYSFYGLFLNTLIESAPVISAKLVRSYGCASMFKNTPISTAPVLRATEVGDYGYMSMFERCTNLTESPKLKTLEFKEYYYPAGVYNGMFRYCSNLVKVYAESYLGYEAYKYWLLSVHTYGVFYTNSSDWPRSASGIRNDWTIEPYE